MEQQCKKEIIGLHKFFEEWFRAEIENSEEKFNRFTNAVGETFQLIIPTGEVVNRKEIIKQIRNNYGRHKDDTFPYRLWIENIECRFIKGNICVMTYEEWGEVNGEKKGRISTAIFQGKNETQNGVEWIHVHETFLP